MRMPTKFAVAASAGAAALLGIAGPAAAATATVTPSTGNYNGQVVTIDAPAGSFTPGSAINVVECTSTAATGTFDPLNQCDGNTVQADTVTAASNGSVHYTNYTLYKLPNPLFGASTITCDSTHPCVLYVGNDQTSASAPHAFTSSILIADNPPVATPEAPYAALLPVGAAALLGGGAFFALRRRKHATSAV